MFPVDSLNYITSILSLYLITPPLSQITIFLNQFLVYPSNISFCKYKYLLICIYICIYFFVILIFYIPPFLHKGSKLDILFYAFCKHLLSAYYVPSTVLRYSGKSSSTYHHVLLCFLVLQLIRVDALISVSQETEFLGATLVQLIYLLLSFREH